MNSDVLFLKTWCNRYTEESIPNHNYLASNDLSILLVSPLWKVDFLTLFADLFRVNFQEILYLNLLVIHGNSTIPT